MLKWRGFGEGFGVIGSGTGILLAVKRRKLSPRAGIASRRIPALGKFTTSWKSKMSSEPY